MKIQSVRNVGCKRGYPYYAYGVYVPQARVKDGKLTYRLVASGPWFRSDVKGLTAFSGVPIVEGGSARNSGQITH